MRRVYDRMHETTGRRHREIMSGCHYEFFHGFNFTSGRFLEIVGEELCSVEGITISSRLARERYGDTELREMTASRLLEFHEFALNDLSLRLVKIV